MNRVVLNDESSAVKVLDCLRGSGVAAGGWVVGNCRGRGLASLEGGGGLLKK